MLGQLSAFGLLAFLGLDLASRLLLALTSRSTPPSHLHFKSSPGLIEVTHIVIAPQPDEKQIAQFPFASPSAIRQHPMPMLPKLVARLSSKLS